MRTDFISGCAQSDETITFAALDRQHPDYEDRFGPCQLIELSAGRWRRRRVEGLLEDIALDADGRVMALTNDRDFIRPALDGPIERISESRPPFAAGLRGLCAIGSSIYACGGNGLIFRRESDGWHGFARQLLTPHPTQPDNHFMTMAGLSEDQVYLLAHSGVFFWDGTQAQVVSGLPQPMLVALHIERLDLVWLCGWDGLLMRGNIVDGFARIPNPDAQMFLSVCEFAGQIYLAGDGKLWAYDGKSITQVYLGLDGHRPLHKLTRAGDALWAIGEDIFRLKVGGRWERISYDPPWLQGSPAP